ncbi:MAG: efflux RND transporter permease subunit [Candidatus Latescibacterota bacterium]
MKNAIIWMGKNPVVSNMVMVLLMVSGYICMGRTRIESFPDFALDQIVIQVPYLGASPKDVEEGVCKRIEERLMGMEGIRFIRSIASENVGSVIIELDRGADLQAMLGNVKQEVDRIDTFPDETEKPVVKEAAQSSRVIDVIIYGEVPERTLKTIANRVRDDLRAYQSISRVDLTGVRTDEISIEVSEENLRRYGLTFDALRAVVAQSSLDLPGGSIKGEAGEILVRATGLKNNGQDYHNIVVLTRPDGTTVTLGQIARITDGFEESDLISRFNGQPAVTVQVFRVGDQNVLEISEYVRQYVDNYRNQLPAHVSIDFSRDEASPLNSRLNLVVENAWMGLILVFVCLSLFLELHLAFWVMLGIPVSFLGCFILMQPLGASINMLSLFGFIIALGIVVDDAIVVGESVFSRREALGHDDHTSDAKNTPESLVGQAKRRLVYMRAAIDGVLDVSTPVLFSVLTSLVGFVPLLFVGGMVGKLAREIPLIVIPVLCVSLVESFFILPAHLASRHGGRLHRFLSHAMSGILNWHTGLRNRVDRELKGFIEGPYSRTLTKTLRNPLTTVSIGVALLLATAGWIGGGHTKFIFFPNVDANWVSVSLTMPLGTTAEQTAEAVQHIERAAAQFKADYEKAGTPIVQNIYTFIGDQPMVRSTDLFAALSPSQGQPHLAEVTVELAPSEIRDMSSTETAAQLRQYIGEIPGIESLTLASSALSVGNPIEIEMTSSQPNQLSQAVEKLKAEIAKYPATSDIQDSHQFGKQELRISLKPQARTLGLTQADLARQVRNGFYGAEALRFQRGSDDVRVMMRYPEAERKSLRDINNMYVRTPQGANVPLMQVANVDLGRGPANIYRSDGQTVVTVTADVNERITTAAEVNDDLKKEVLPVLMRDYPGLTCSFVGQQREQQDFMADLASGYTIAFIIIAGLLAIPFRSYIQPLVIMSVIPFGAIGAVLGHILLGMDLTVLSMLGFLALSGVIVNDSMLLVDCYNQFRREGQDRDDALIQAGRARFRPIILTSLTTFLGLLPMILERSVQAQFLIPMAVSLGVGLIFATFIILIGVPAILYILVHTQESLGYNTVEDETIYMLEQTTAQGNQQ